MPGGNKNIGPNDGKKFDKNYNGRDFEKWTEQKCLEMLDLLEDWLLKKVPVLDDKGICTHMVDAGNVFYKEFLYQNRLFDDWITYVGKKFSSVSERMEYINNLQEHKLQKLTFEGKGKEGIAKFILQNKHNWREKVDQKVDQTLTQIEWKEEKTYTQDKKEDNKNK